MTNEEKINLIGQKILLLSNNLDKYKIELNQLQQQLDVLKQLEQHNLFRSPVVPLISNAPKATEKIPEIKTVIPIEKIPESKTEDQAKPLFIKPLSQQTKASSDFNFEEFIGSKLINIIGIIILVIGMGIGVKYAIEKDCLSIYRRRSSSCFSIKIKNQF